jgi:hypothetical protein
MDVLVLVFRRPTIPLPCRGHHPRVHLVLGAVRHERSRCQPPKKTRDRAVRGALPLLVVRLAGRIDLLVEWLREIVAEHAGTQPGLAEEISKQADYFETNMDRMRYPEFREQGFFVGSGVIEAGCESIVGVRLKQLGMFWTIREANSIIALRCCWFNQRFEDFWAETRAA